MVGAGLAVARNSRMTRSPRASRTATRRVARVIRPVRDPSIAPLAFTCFRLVPIVDPSPDEPELEPIELCQTSNAMGAFMRVR
jgi:hypothetical protein